MFKVEFVAMTNLSTVSSHWISTEQFGDKISAMVFAQAVLRGMQNSPFTLYYRILKA